MAAQTEAEEAQRPTKPVGTTDGGRGKGGKEEVIGDEEKLTPEQRLARNITSGASAYCRFVGSVRPPKLMPGQSGTMLVTALLQGTAVLPAPAQLELISPAQQGIVTLGVMTMRAAEPGRLAAGYLGRPVYENYAVLEIPVTMSPDAKVGQKHTINAEFKFDLYDGASAQVINRFLDRAVAEVEVGLALDPPVAGGPARPEPSHGATSESAPIAAQPSSPSVAKSQTGPLAGNPVVPAESSAPPTAVQPAAAVATPSVDDTESELPIVPVAVGGALLLGVVFLLARKKS